MPTGNPGTARHVVEIRDSAGASLLLTSIDWTGRQRDLAMSAILKLVGFKPAAAAKRLGNKGHRAPSAKAAPKK